MKPLARSHSWLRSTRIGLLLLSACACSSELNLGSDILWATDHETGDLSDWYAPPPCVPSCGKPGTPGGGLLPDTSKSPAPQIVAGPAHSGRYSLKFMDLAGNDMIGPGVYREIVAPPDAYYSVWYYIPRLYQTNSQWTIQKFEAHSDSDPSAIYHGHDLNLRTLPGGQVILYVFSHDPTYLQAPLADPPAFVPVETWFHVEVLYRPRTDETGKIVVWLNDRLVYDLENRRTAPSNEVIWAPCDIGEDIQPLGTVTSTDGAAGAGNADGAGGEAGVPGVSDSATRIAPELYIDDAAISLHRIGRAGRLGVDR